MKKIVPLFVIAAVLCLSATLVRAADDAKAVTLKGTATCAKCDLKQTEKCQAALKVTEDGKEVVYYIKGPQAKAIHGEVCKAPKENVEVTGVVSTDDKGQKWITTAEKEKAADK